VRIAACAIVLMPFARTQIATASPDGLIAS
jgi:hypothetical protein